MMEVSQWGENKDKDKDKRKHKYKDKKTNTNTNTKTIQIRQELGGARRWRGVVTEGETTKSIGCC